MSGNGGAVLEFMRIKGAYKLAVELPHGTYEWNILWNVLRVSVAGLEGVDVFELIQDCVDAGEEPLGIERESGWSGLVLFRAR